MARGPAGSDPVEQGATAEGTRLVITTRSAADGGRRRSRRDRGSGPATSSRSGRARNGQDHARPRSLPRARDHGPVTSPTFTIAHRYAAGPIRLASRSLSLSGLSPAEWGDLEPYFDDAVVFVEWPRGRPRRLPSPRLAIGLAHEGGDDGDRARRGRRGAARRDRGMLILAFDTATDVATSALVDDGTVLGERASVPRSLLADVDALLDDAGVAPAALDALVVGTGPGSFPAPGSGCLGARPRARPGSPGRRRLHARRAGRGSGRRVPGRRRASARGLRPRTTRPASRRPRPRGRHAVRRDGAVRYRPVLARRGGRSAGRRPAHVPHARLHARLARALGAVDDVLPIYVRAPDADGSSRDDRPSPARAPTSTRSR